MVLLVGGTTLAQMIGVLASPLLTRLYTPTDFGEFSVVMALVAVLVVVSSLTYDFAIPLPASHSEAANVVALCLFTIAVVSSITAVALLLGGGTLLTWLGAGSLASASLLVLMGQISGATIAVVKQWAVRTKSFSLIATNSLIQATAVVGAQLLLGIASLGSVGLLSGALVGSMAGFTRLARAAWNSHQDAFRQVSWSGMWRAARRYRRFAFLSTPSVLLNTLTLRAPILLVVALYGAELGGMFALAQRVVALPAVLIAGAAGQVFFAQAAPLARTSVDELHALFVRISLSLAAAAIVPTILLMVFAPMLFRSSSVKPGRTPAGWSPSWLHGSSSTSSSIRPPLCLMSRSGKTCTCYEDFVRLVSLGIAAATMIIFDLGPLEAVGALSIASTVNYCVYWLISAYAIRHRRRNPRPP